LYIELVDEIPDNDRIGLVNIVNTIHCRTPTANPKVNADATSFDKSSLRMQDKERR